MVSYLRHIYITCDAREEYSSGDISFSRRIIASGLHDAISSILVRKLSGYEPGQSFLFVMHIISDIEIIVQNRLQAFLGHVAVHFLEASGVVDFKLFVALFAVCFLS